MQEYPKISVVIPSYYRLRYLVQTILEVLRQRHKAVLEIIVVDQTPASVKKVSKEGQQIEEWVASGTIVYHFLSPPNANAARNRGLALSKGDIVLLLDDDVLLPPNFIEEHYKMYLSTFDGHKVVAVGGKSYHRKNISSKEVDHINHKNYKLYTSPDQRGYEKPLQFLKAKDTLVGCNMSFSRETALAILGFDENFSSYYDEADFCFRLKKYCTDKKQGMLVNQHAYLIHLRAYDGGHGLRNEHSNRELLIILSYNLFFIRHYSIIAAIPKLLQNIRIGPLRKANVLNPKRFFYSCWCFSKSIYLAYKLKDKVKSPFLK